MAKYPAAFINVIAEDGTKDEAITYLQQTWDQLMDCRAALAASVRRASSNGDQQAQTGTAMRREGV